MLLINPIPPPRHSESQKTGIINLPGPKKGKVQKYTSLESVTTSSRASASAARRPLLRNIKVSRQLPAHKKKTDSLNLEADENVYHDLFS